MKIRNSGGTYYSNLKRLVRLRPKYRPTGYRGERSDPNDLSGLIWSEATMTWSELTETWGDLA